MRKPTGHKEKYSVKSEISKCCSDDETAARTRPFSFDEIMLRRKNKKKSENVEGQRIVSEVVGSKEGESVFDHLESGRHGHRHRDVVGGSERKDSRDELKMREDKIAEREYKDSKNAHIRSKIVSDNVRDRTDERCVHEKRKNENRLTDDIDHKYGKRHGKEIDVKDRDRNVERNRGKYEKNSKRRTENGYDERDRDQDAGNKHESRKGFDSSTSDRKQQKGTSESHHDDLKLKYDERDGNQDVGKKHESRKGYDYNTSERKQQKGTSDSHHDEVKSKYEERDRDQDAGKKHDSRKGYDSSTLERKQEKRTSESKREDLKLKYAEHDRDQDVGKKHEPRKLYDSNTSERKQQKGRYESQCEDLKSKYDERDRDQDVGEKIEPKKLYDSNTSERKQQKGRYESQREDLKSKSDERDRDQDVGEKLEPKKLYDSNTSERKQPKGTSESQRGDLKSKYDERDRDRDVGKKHEPQNSYDYYTSERKQRKPTLESHHEDFLSKYDERDRNEDVEKKREPKKLYDSNTSERKQQKRTSETLREDLKSRSKRSRSREDEREKRKKSNSPSPRGHKQRLHETREREELSSHSSKDGKKISNNDSSNKSKRHDTSRSRLGGYSPRKRRSEAAVKTPSPITHSPEKKNTTWDSPSVKLESNLALLNKTEVFNKHEVPSILTPIGVKPNLGVISSIPLMMNASVDSVQLTQATRPKRRIYVENLPPSASEAAVIQWLSGYLRPYGLNHVQGMSPCISCIVNKEKGQALVEFLTPEDASTALHFDGKSFSGNILKIRRPKDYVETTTGVSEKPVAGAVSVRHIVKDTSNKIFIGGISKVITSKMLMEMVSAFGPLKAYHFESNTCLDSQCAFLEYADQSVTVKACVGLNGMKLGGQFLTVTQATPDASSVGNYGDQPFYGTPVHAQPLLEKPTQVLKLNNVLDPHSLPSLSELELEEILEDIRLECARFGMVKSIHITKQTDMLTSSETIIVSKEATSMVNEVTEPTGSDLEQHEEVKESTHVGGTSEPENANRAVGANVIVGNKHENKIVKNETEDTTMVDSTIENQNLEENSNQISYEINQLELNDIKSTDDTVTENKTLKAELHDTVKDDLSECNVNFEVGCVLVEYKRTESSSMAAHCLHGRVFDGRTVTVEYVSHDVYCTRFCK